MFDIIKVYNSGSLNGFSKRMAYKLTTVHKDSKRCLMPTSLRKYFWDQLVRVGLKLALGS